MNEVNLKIEDQHVDHTITVPNALIQSGFSVTIQPDFQLNLVDFNELKRPQRKCDLFATSILLLGIGLLITCCSKLIANEFGYNTKLETYELIAGLTALFISLCFWVFGYYSPNPKKELLNRIDTFFKENKPSRSFIKGSK